MSMIRSGTESESNEVSTESQIPMMAVDALYDRQVATEKMAFRREVVSLWNAIANFSALPVEHIKMVEARVEELEKMLHQYKKELNALRKEGKERTKEYELLLQKFEEAVAEIDRLKERMKLPFWLENTPWIVAALLALKATCPSCMTFLVQEFVKMSAK